MSEDLFARLAARALGRVALARPRVGYRFAAGPELPADDELVAGSGDRAVPGPPARPAPAEEPGFRPRRSRGRGTREQAVGTAPGEGAAGEARRGQGGEGRADVAHRKAGKVPGTAAGKVPGTAAGTTASAAESPRRPGSGR